MAWSPAGPRSSPKGPPSGRHGYVAMPPAAELPGGEAQEQHAATARPAPGPAASVISSLEAFGNTVLRGAGVACSVMSCGSHDPTRLHLDPGDEKMPSSPSMYGGYSEMYASEAQLSGVGSPMTNASTLSKDPAPASLLSWAACPSLRVPGVTPARFEYSCALVVSSWEGDEWIGRFRMREHERVMLLKAIDRGQQDGRLTLEEMQQFPELPESSRIVEKMPGSAKGLLNRDFVKEVFDKFDSDKNGYLNCSEWDSFMDVLADLHAVYMVSKCQLAFRAFWGRAAPWNMNEAQEQRSHPQQVLVRASGSMEGDENRIKDCFQIGRDPDCLDGRLFAPGWWEDLFYYSANNHPLHGILAADPIHPLSRIERLAMEVALFGFLLHAMADQLIHDKEIAVSAGSVTLLTQVTELSLVRVTIPSMVGWWVLFFLFTCPCLIVNEAQSIESRLQRIARWSCHLVGYSLVIIGLYFFCYGFITGNEEYNATNAAWIAVARLRGFIISWGLEVCIYFNPFLAWGQPDPAKTGSLRNGFFGYCGDMIGLGQWRIEKQLFQARCAVNAHRWKSFQWATNGADSQRTRSSWLAGCLDGPAKAPTYEFIK